VHTGIIETEKKQKEIFIIEYLGFSVFLFDQVNAISA